MEWIIECADVCWTMGGWLVNVLGAVVAGLSALILWALIRYAEK